MPCQRCAALHCASRAPSSDALAPCARQRLPMSLDELKHVPGLAHSKLERHGLHFLHVVLRAVAEHRGEAVPPAPEGFLDTATAHVEPLPSQGGGPAWGGPAPLQGFAPPRASIGGAAAAQAAAAAAAARAAAAAEALDGVDLEALDDDDFVPPPPKAQRTEAEPEAQQQPAEQRRASAAEEWAADGGEDWDGGWGDT